MRVLLTNDDGIDSPGLIVLAQTFLLHGAHVDVVAPSVNQSALSTAVNILTPVTLAQLQEWPDGARNKAETVMALDASPATCIVAALNTPLVERPEIVLSGINAGPNLGLDIFTSGTVGGARMANLLGLPSLAVSTLYPPNADWQQAAELAFALAEILLADPLLDPLLWNLNVPPGPQSIGLAPPARLSAFQWTRPFVDPQTDQLRIRLSHEAPAPPPPGTDAWYFTRGWASLSALPLDAALVCDPRSATVADRLAEKLLTRSGSLFDLPPESP